MDPNLALKKYFNLDHFRPGQKEIIEVILSGKNVLAVLPTGAGKSLCFQIPALIKDNFSIVVSPLIALMKDQVDSINKINEVAAFINSSLSYTETEAILRSIQYGKIKILYISPERLEKTDFAQRLKDLSPEYLFIDEAHCISEWGHNFRPSYTKIKNFIEFSSIKKISAFTATATPEVVKDIIKQLGLKEVKLIIRGFERNNLYVNVEITKRKKERCLELYHQYKSPAIIYASSRKKAEELSQYFILNKINCEYFHAGIDPIVRKKIQENFIEGRLPLIIATNAFGMGIDKKDIRLVIHYNSPGSIENYYQEIGRAGRDGKNAYTFLLYDDNDKNIHDYFISTSYPTKDIIKKIYNAICDYAQIAVGMVNEHAFPIKLDYIKLHTKEDISVSILNSSLKYLEDAGYIQINSAFKSANKIRVLLESARLKKFIKSTTNELMKDVLLSLVRNYGNDLFTRITNINFSDIIYETGLTNQELHDTLSNLEYMGILEFSRADGKESITLLRPRVTSDDLKLNYKLINELYISSKQKLDKIVHFVYSNECRFKYILNYFGEEAKEFSCGKCDNCLRNNPDEETLLFYVKEKITDLLNELTDGLSENEISEILLGNTKETKLKKSDFYNSLRNYSKADIVRGVKFLIRENLIQEKKISNKKIYFIRNVDSSKTIINDPTNESKIDLDLDLFHKLRQAREKASKKFLQAPNIICPDEVLAKISKQKPKTKIELMSIEGFNERMFNKIGNDFLEMINLIQADIKARKVNEIPKNIIETYKLLQKKYSLEEIVKLRRLTDSVISMQIETILEYSPETDISAIISEEELNLISSKYKTGIKTLKGLKEVLPKNISYPKIRIALAKIEHQGF